jgi:hypothetical protein
VQGPAAARHPFKISDRGLAETYAPTLVFTPNEKWWPVRTSAFTSNPFAQVTGDYAGPRDQPPNPLPKRCPGQVQVPCFNLTIHCEISRFCQDPPDHPKRAVYVRVIRRGESRRQLGPGSDPFARTAGQYKSSPDILIQYWMFYRYNDWNRPVLSGELSERHEGDWEAVTIGLSKTKPLFVGYSQHCGGAWLPWGRVRVASNRVGNELHPIVAVAEGSHANYPEADARHAPDWAACQGVPAGTTTAIDYASNIRDETQAGPTWQPQRRQLILTNSHRRPMNFPGHWGASTRTVLINQRPHVLSDDPGGPPSPPLQALWKDPLGQIFCSDNWQPHECPKPPEEPDQ